MAELFGEYGLARIWGDHPTFKWFSLICFVTGILGPILRRFLVSRNNRHLFPNTVLIGLAQFPPANAYSILSGLFMCFLYQVYTYICLSVCMRLVAVSSCICIYIYIFLFFTHPFGSRERMYAVTSSSSWLFLYIHLYNHSINHPLFNSLFLYITWISSILLKVYLKNHHHTWYKRFQMVSTTGMNTYVCDVLSIVAVTCFLFFF